MCAIFDFGQASGIRTPFCRRRRPRTTIMFCPKTVYADADLRDRWFKYGIEMDGQTNDVYRMTAIGKRAGGKMHYSKSRIR